MTRITKNYLLVIILAAGIFLRLNNFDYPLVSEETNRDFIVARHIYRYQEIPLTGPNNGTLPLVGNSPVYNYLLAWLLFVRDDFMFLGILNILFQVLAVVLWYSMTMKSFGKGTGVLVAVFLSLASVFVDTAIWPWQPYVMFGFYTLATYLLFKFYLQRKMRYLMWSLVVLAFSSAIHMSVVAIWPAFFVTTFISMRLQNKKPTEYIFTAAVFIFSLFVFYSPLIFGDLFLTNSYVGIYEKLTVQGNRYFLSLAERIHLLLESLSIHNTILFLAISLGPLYLVWQKNTLQKIIYLVFWLAAASYLIVFSMIDGRFFNQHLYPVLPIFVVVISESFYKLSSVSNLTVVLKKIIIVFLALILFRGSTSQINIFKFEKLKAINNITTELSEEILKLSKDANYTNLNFFQFKVFTPQENHWFEGNMSIADAVYWLNLEKSLNYKFVTVSDYGSESGYRLLNDDRYIFLACVYYKSEVEERSDCLKRFSEENPQYTLIKKVGRTNYGQSFFLYKKYLPGS